VGTTTNRSGHVPGSGRGGELPARVAIPHAQCVGTRALAAGSARRERTFLEAMNQKRFEVKSGDDPSLNCARDGSNRYVPRSPRFSAHMNGRVELMADNTTSCPGPTPRGRTWLRRFLAVQERTSSSGRAGEFRISAAHPPGSAAEVSRYLALRGNTSFDGDSLPAKFLEEVHGSLFRKRPARRRGGCAR